jgi:hypothetical protein
VAFEQMPIGVRDVRRRVSNRRSSGSSRQELSDRQKTRKLAKLDELIDQATAELREASKAEALAAVEAQFAGEAA